MKKKLLSIVLGLVMGLGCMAALVGCNDGDAKIAQSAVDTLKEMYEKVDVEVRADYQVVGQIKASDDKAYLITWTSDSANAVVGTMDNTTKKVTIAITPADDVISYKLSAAVTVGKATKSVTFNRKILAKAKDATGTENDPFSVAKVLEIGATLSSGDYYKGSGTKPLQVYVEGYVVDPGTQFAAGRAANVYIVDEYDESKDKSSPDALQVYSLSYDSTYIKQLGDIAKGDKLKLHSFIQKYNSTIELTYLPSKDNNNEGDVVSVCAGKTDARNDSQKITDALAKVSNITVTKAGPYTLPTATVSDVEYKWSTTDTTYTIDATGKTLSVAALPKGENATLQATVAATCGSVTTPVEKTITITIQKEAELAEGEVKLDLSFNTIGTTGWSGSYTAHEVSFEDAGASVGGTIKFSEANKQSSTITDYPVIAPSGNTQYVTVALEEGTIKSVEFSLEQWNTKTLNDIHIEYFNGTVWSKCSEVITTPAKLASNSTLPAGVQYVRLSMTVTGSSRQQLGLSAIKLMTDPDGESSLNPPTGNEGTDTPEPTPPATTGTFTPITSPVAGTEYYISMAVSGKNNYVTGSLTGSANQYLATTEDISAAAKVTLEADGEGWNIKVGGKYLEIVINGTYNNAKFSDTRQETSIHWVWDAEKATFTWTNANNTFFLGSQGTYTTVSVSQIKYFSENNKALVGTYSAN